MPSFNFELHEKIENGVEIVQIQATASYCRIIPSIDHYICFRYLFQIVQTQTTAAYCKISPMNCTTRSKISFQVIQSHLVLVYTLAARVSTISISECNLKLSSLATSQVYGQPMDAMCYLQTKHTHNVTAHI